MGNFKIVLSSHVTLTKMEDKLVLFSKKSGDFYGLNESALFLLKTLLESDFHKTLKVAAHEFNEDENVIQSDLEELVTSLESADVLKKVPCE